MLGILDPDGKNNNPLTNKPYSDEYKILAKKWREYPAYKNPVNTIQEITDNNVILVISGTGSGKTVLIPKYTLHSFNYDCKIAIILPKQILAKSSAEFAAKTLDVELGKEVGYKHRGEKNYDKDITKLLYTTDGTLVSMLLNDPDLKDYNAVIIDEAHERRTQTDFLLYLLKQICMKRKDFKLIIMSATIDETIFSEYFRGLKYTSINISGKTNFPISHIYLQTHVDKNNYIEEGIKQIKEIINTTTDGDILFFVPNVAETFNSCHKITDNNNFCIEVYAGMSLEKEKLAVDKDLYKTKFNKKRKIIIATNVAESSLTIDGIKYVIDSGYENFSYYNPNINSKVIEKRMVSQAQIKQRCGRTGRTSHGICYHLYSSGNYEKLIKFPKPSIQTSNIYTECLSLLTWTSIQTFDNLEKVLLDFIEPPTQEYIDNAKTILLKLGLIENNKITKFGLFISSLPLEPMQSIAIYTGWMLNVSKEVLMILMLVDAIKFNIGELFYFDKNERDIKKIKKFEQVKNNIMKKNSDHYTLLKIFLKYRKLKKQSEEKLNEWIQQSYLKKSTLDKVNKYYKKAKNDCIRKINVYMENPENKDFIENIKNNEKINELKKQGLKKRIMISLYKGFFLNTMHMTSMGYKNNKINIIKISKDSWMSNTEKKRIMYSDILTFGNQSYAQINSYITKNITDSINIIPTM
ncbi:putative ATP-dependent RNA helicase [Bodo saltans virus]|uniref:RNA helicase n=1 Tax=Bodo saltans virus TaxID=2024608 RepID=A0A2H4UU36_9VIRU|nr:putative ATP-dependent RNA helicase [Bodo saltans virus]ATZ80349.1 putative ATP-dependent RNA helicase [Bodo saltans virus]